MSTESKDFPLFLYLYDKNGRYRKPITIEDESKLFELMRWDMLHHIRLGLKTVITDRDDYCIFLSENREIKFPQSNKETWIKAIEDKGLISRYKYHNPDPTNTIMAEPKAKEIDELLTKITGKDRISCIATNQCVMCETPNLNFKTSISRKEYGISGMCQNCQDTGWIN